MPTPEPQRKYNQSEQGRKVRSNYNKENRQHLEQKRGSRVGECSVCGKTKWLVRKHPPICKKCNQDIWNYNTTNKDSLQESQCSIQQILEAETNNFVELAKIAGLDIATDFAGADLSGTDLSGVDFSNADLSGVDFRGANLSNVNFSNANLSNAKFSEEKNG